MSKKKEGYFASIKRRDPAARHMLQIILTYPGVHAMFFFRIAHFFYRIHLKLIGEWIMFMVRMTTGIEIHPNAKIGKHLFIDHGTGIVIGETSIIGDNVTMYHGVTLGGRSLAKEKRHPTLGNDITIGTGAKILGNVTVGEGTIIGANAFITKDVPPYSNVIGINQITPQN